MINQAGNLTIEIKEVGEKTEYREKKENSKLPDSIKTYEIKKNVNKTDDITNITRCMKCNKKLKLTAIKCKCNNYYCDVHRYSDRHECSFDYKKKGKKLIEKTNPIITSSKLDKL